MGVPGFRIQSRQTLQVVQSFCMVCDMVLDNSLRFTDRSSAVCALLGPSFSGKTSKAYSLALSHAAAGQTVLYICSRRFQESPPVIMLFPIPFYASNLHRFSLLERVFSAACSKSFSGKVYISQVRKIICFDFSTL